MAAQFNMRSGIFMSVSGHVALVLVAQFGLPHFFSPPPVAVEIIPVELVTIDDLNVPPPPATPEPEPEPEPEPQVTAAPPPAPEPPPPPPEPEPEPVVAPPPPVEKPKPPEPKPAETKPEPEPEPKPTQLAKAQPRSKPKPPKPRDEFASVLKNLRDLDAPEAPRNREDAPPPDEGKVSPTPQLEQQASITEIERLKQMIREQVQPCWSPPIGAVDAEDLRITIFIRVDQRGFVREAKVVDAPSLAFNSYAQAAADAARRAVLNPRCQPFELPQKRYDLWKEIRFNFDPREALG